jgi:hypothetical protein
MNPNGKSDFPGANMHRSAQDLVSLHQLRMQHKVIYWSCAPVKWHTGFS